MFTVWLYREWQFVTLLFVSKRLITTKLTTRTGSDLQEPLVCAPQHTYHQHNTITPSITPLLHHVIVTQWPWHHDTVTVAQHHHIIYHHHSITSSHQHTMQTHSLSHNSPCKHNQHVECRYLVWSTWASAGDVLCGVVPLRTEMETRPLSQ